MPYTFSHLLQSLKNKLPFDDDEFDHVHIDSIARGVPEPKESTLPAGYPDT